LAGHGELLRGQLFAPFIGGLLSLVWHRSSYYYSPLSSLWRVSLRAWTAKMSHFTNGNANVTDTSRAQRPAKPLQKGRLPPIRVNPTKSWQSRR
jgi:hypothetical protein